MLGGVGQSRIREGDMIKMEAEIEEDADMEMETKTEAEHKERELRRLEGKNGFSGPIIK